MTVNRLMQGFVVLAIIYLWIRLNFLIDATWELDRRIKLLAGGLMELKEEIK